MTSYFNPFAYMRAPLSGDVMQDIFARFFSPTINMEFAGDREIEAEIVSDVASYGKQLGKLTEALIAVAEKSGADGPEIDSLRTLRDQVEDAKARQRDDAYGTAARATARLKRTDPAQARKIAQDTLGDAD